jgi:hypothetical protein
MYEIIYQVMVSLAFNVVNVEERCLLLFISGSNLLPIPFFRVGETGAWDELPEVHTNNSIASYVVKRLLPFTVYSFRILAVNQLGVSLPSKESYYICTLREGET